MATPFKPPHARGFAVDAQTERALRAGLAGYESRVQRGRLAVALRSLASDPASRLVFVDLDGISEPETAARRLIEVCAFDTALIAIGSADSAHLSRTLLQAGMADYLVKPISPAAVRDACAAQTDDALDRLYAGEVIAFAGSPGSGTSTLVAAVARAFAAGGRTVSVIDLDPFCGKMPVLLGSEPEDGLAAFLRSVGPDAGEAAETHNDPQRIDAISIAAEPGVSLIAYPPSGAPAPPPSRPQLSALFKHMANRTHVVLVTGLSDPETLPEIMALADARVLLYEPTLPSIGAAVRVMARVGPDSPVTIVQCSTRTRRPALSAAHIRYALADRRPDVVIPFEPAILATSDGKAPRRPGTAYRKALQQVADLLGSGSPS